MSWLSTYDQSISAKNGIGGKTLRDKFIEDGIVRQTDTGKWEFDSDKINKNSKSSTEFRYEACNDYTNGTCFSDDGNSISFLAFSKNDADDFMNRQEEAVMNISNIYKDTPFYIHSSYCPGGCCPRETGLDTYITNGEYSDSKGNFIQNTISVPKDWFFRVDEPNKVGIKLDNGVTDTINRSDVEVDGDFCRLYVRPEDPSTGKVFKPCHEKLERLRKEAEESEYRAMMDIDDDMSYGDD